MIENERTTKSKNLKTARDRLISKGQSRSKMTLNNNWSIKWWNIFNALKNNDCVTRVFLLLKISFKNSGKIKTFQGNQIKYLLPINYI